MHHSQGAQGFRAAYPKGLYVTIKSKFLAAAATLTLVGGVGVAGVLTAGTASAATPSCGNSCVDPFSFQFGTHATPNYVLDVFRQGDKTGQPIILFRSSNDDPAEDFTASFQGPVSDFYAAGLVSSAVDLHYGGQCEDTIVTSPSPTPTVTVTATPSPAPTVTVTATATATATVTATPSDPPSAKVVKPQETPSPVIEQCAEYYPNLYAWELQYSPFGVDSGLCVGVAATAVSGEGVTLQPCGVSSKTVWITDTVNAAGWHDSYVPVINGSDVNFSQPFVLDYPHSGFPTDKPRPQLYVDNLTGFSNGSFLDWTGVIDTQEWGADWGPLP